MEQPPNPPPGPSSETPAAVKKSKMPWILGGSGCLVLLLLFTALGIYFVTQGFGHGKRLEYNGGELYYTSSVTEAEAKKLGEYLLKGEFFNGRPKTVQLNKTGTTYEFRLCIQKGAEHDASSIETFKNLAHFMSLNVFDGRPVVVHLCDENLKTLRVVTPDPITQ